MTESTQPKFVQITATGSDLYGLDEQGGVWVYFPAMARRHAFWTQLTERRADTRDKTLNKKEGDVT